MGAEEVRMSTFPKVPRGFGPRRPRKPRKAAFQLRDRVYSTLITQTPSGRHVARGERGTVEAIADSRERFLVRWDNYPNEPGWYSTDALQT